MNRNLTVLKYRKSSFVQCISNDKCELFFTVHHSAYRYRLSFANRNVVQYVHELNNNSGLSLVQKPLTTLQKKTTKTQNTHKINIMTITLSSLDFWQRILHEAEMTVWG